MQYCLAQLGSILVTIQLHATVVLLVHRRFLDPLAALVIAAIMHQESAAVLCVLLALAVLRRAQG